MYLLYHYHAYGESSLSTPGTLRVSLLIISEISCSDTVSHILFSCDTGLVGLTIHSFHPCLSLAANSVASGLLAFLLQLGYMIFLWHSLGLFARQHIYLVYSEFPNFQALSLLQIRFQTGLPTQLLDLFRFMCPC